MDIISHFNTQAPLAFRPEPKASFNSIAEDTPQLSEEILLGDEQLDEQLDKPPAADTQTEFATPHLDELVSDRWVFKFSFGDDQEMVTEIIDAETGNVIKQVSFDQDMPNPIGALLDITV